MKMTQYNYQKVQIVNKMLSKKGVWVDLKTQGTTAAEILIEE
jgi:hypothetical protein